MRQAEVQGLRPPAAYGFADLYLVRELCRPATILCS